MQTSCDDLLAEYEHLAQFCASLSTDDWFKPSDFYGWTAWDEVAHLCYFDQTALQSVTDPEVFVADAKVLTQGLAAGQAISAVARAHFADLDGPALLATWQHHYETLVQALRQQDPKARLQWYGPSMSAKSFATARLMETWAHGQDIWDVMQADRPASHRLRAIAHIGVSTFGWTFINRNLPVPETVPYVELQAPDGGLWTWGDPSASECLRGSAQDFCLLVTQRRHRDDTQLQWQGEAADAWSRMAQCFAGPAVDGPAPGVRRRR